MNFNAPSDAFRPRLPAISGDSVYCAHLREGDGPRPPAHAVWVRPAPSWFIGLSPPARVGETVIGYPEARKTNSGVVARGGGRLRRKARVTARILVGSCSWTDPSLISCGRFYPRGVSSAEARLRYYAQHFPIVEVDATYYAPPTQRNSVLWAARTPPGFVFDIKAHGLLTGHPARIDLLPSWLRESLPTDAAGKKNVYRNALDADTVDRLWELHRTALAPLATAGKLGALLFQFPPWFTCTRDNEEYLRALPRRLPGWPLAVEFRGGGWMAGSAAAHTLSLLEDAGLAYVSVDEPQGFPSSTPPLAAATAPLAVVRLHGRNRDTWSIKTSAASQRFRYLYSDAELQEWVPHVRELAAQTQTVHVLFNNNYEDWGMRNALRMAQLLELTYGRPTELRLDLG